MDVTMRRAAASDRGLLGRAVYAAWRWHEPWDPAAYAAHAARNSPDSYVEGFGSHPGDAGLIATLGRHDGPFCGAAWFRLFTADSARAGYVDDTTPELVLAVAERHRGQGIGGRLLDGLLELAAEQAQPGLSLHVDSANSAASALYRSRGFQPVRPTSKGMVMAWSRAGRNQVVGGIAMPAADQAPSA